MAQDAPFRIDISPNFSYDPLEPGEAVNMLRGQLSFFQVAVTILDGVPGNIALSWTGDPPGGPDLYLYNAFGPSTVVSHVNCAVVPGDYVLTIKGTRTDGAVATTPLLARVTEGAWGMPLADFTWEQEGSTFQFTDASVDDRCRFDANPGAWSWTFGDGTSSAEENPVHTYASPGNYTVRLLLPRTAQWDHARGVLVYRQIDKVVTATAP